MQEIEKFFQTQIYYNSIYAWTTFFTILLLFRMTKGIFFRLFFSFASKIATKTKNDFDDRLVENAKVPISCALTYLGLWLALHFVAFPDNIQISIATGMEVFLLVIIFLTAFKALNLFLPFLQAFFRKTNSELSNDIAGFLTTTLKMVLFVMAALTVLDELGVNVSALVASLGIGGLAVAMAAKDTVANLFGSMVIFSDRPFKVGDWIKTPDVEGVIENIGMRSTRVRTFSQALVSVPNATIANTPITNWSRMKKRRIKMTIGLTYSTTTKQMKQILSDIRAMLKAHKDVHPSSIFINFTDYNASDLGIFCYFFTNTTNWGEYMMVREDINLKIMQIVQNAGASFAFPSTSLYIEKGEQSSFKT